MTDMGNTDIIGTVIEKRCSTLALEVIEMMTAVYATGLAHCIRVQPGDRVVHYLDAMHGENSPCTVVSVHEGGRMCVVQPDFATTPDDFTAPVNEYVPLDPERR